MTDLNGRHALVTGGTRGIGAAIARKLSEAGACVVVSARSRGDYGGEAHFIPADLSTPDGPPRLAAQALEYLGGIDILVDNAASQTVVPDGVLATTSSDRRGRGHVVTHPGRTRADPAGNARRLLRL